MVSKKIIAPHKLFWHIQRSKHKTCSKALQTAGAIIGREDVAILYLTRKLNHHRTLPDKMLTQFALFG